MIQEEVMLLCPMECFLHASFARTLLPVDGHKKDEKRPTTTKNTFSAMELKFQDPDTEQEKQKKKKEEEEKKKRKKDEKNGAKEKTSSSLEG